MGLLNRSCDYRGIARITARPGGNAGIKCSVLCSPSVAGSHHYHWLNPEAGQRAKELGIAVH